MCYNCDIFTYKESNIPILDYKYIGGITEHSPFRGGFRNFEGGGGAQTKQNDPEILKGVLIKKPFFYNKSKIKQKTFTKAGGHQTPWSFPWIHPCCFDYNLCYSCFHLFEFSTKILIDG